MGQVSRLLRRAGGLALLLGGLACGSDASGPSPEPPPPESCELPARPLPNGECMRPGVPVDGCGPGFVHDGEYGCRPVLPEGPCFDGLMALPGDASCHTVMDCGAGAWGDLPVDDATIYVDASYGGTDSDGTEARPFTFISDAVAAAPAGALVAVAEGTYAEDLVVEGKPLRVWGRCPERVVLQGTAASAGPCGATALCIAAGASGSEVGGLAVEGPAGAAAVDGALDVRLERLWIHDAGGAGLAVADRLGPASVALVGSLVESNRLAGVSGSGAVIAIEGSVLRGNLPDATSGRGGWGVGAQLHCDAGLCDPGRSASLSVVGSVVDANQEHGIFVMGSSATIEGSVVRGTTTAPGAPRGHGVNVTACEPDDGCEVPSSAGLVMRQSVVDDNERYGMFLEASDIAIEDSVVRRTRSSSVDETRGRGVVIQLSCTTAGCDASAPSTGAIARSAIEDNVNVGLMIGASPIVVEDSVVRRTAPDLATGDAGRGVEIEACTPSQGCFSAAPASVDLVRSLVETSRVFGVAVVGSEARLDGVIVEHTAERLSDGLYGDGVIVVHEPSLASALIANSVIDDSLRAGVSSFGGSVTLVGSTIACAPVELAGEPHQGQDFSFEDAGGNACGCPAEAGCVVKSAGLAPPEPLPY